MSWRAIAAFLVICSLGSMGADCGPQRPPRPAGRVPATHPGSCDGFVSCGEELEVADTQLLGTAAAGLGLVDAEIRLQLRNTGPARVRSASAVPDFAGAASPGACW